MPETALILPTAEPVDIAEAKNHASISDLDLQSLRMVLCIQQGRSACEHKTRQQCLHARYVLTLDAFPQAGYGTPAVFSRTVSIPGYAIRLPHAPAVAVVSVEYMDMSGTWQTMAADDYVTNLALKPGIVTPAFGKVWPIAMPQIASVRVTYDAGYSSPVTAAVGSPAVVTVSGPVAWPVGTALQFFNSGGALPGGLKANTTYLVSVAPGGGVYTITSAAGGAVTIADAGSGTHYVGPQGERGIVPVAMRGWIAIRASTLYESREEVAILQRGHIEELPFMEGLLDACRVATL